MASLLPDNTPARRIFETLSRRVQHMQPRFPLDLDTETLISLTEAASRFNLDIEVLASQWLAEKAAEYRLQLELEATWETLTPKERSVAGRFCAGYEEREIADAEDIKPVTVRQHLRNAMQKFAIKKRSHLRHLLRNWDFSAFDQ